MTDRSAADASTLLFVPGDRPERFPKAFAAGADLVVLDLEDAVAADRKEYARKQVTGWLAARPGGAVRVNAAGTRWHDEDVAALGRLRCPVMLPKAEPAGTRAVSGRVHALIALVETASGVLDARATASIPSVQRLAFGSFDLASELDADPDDRTALASARGHLVLASAAAGLPGPIDGVTADLRNAEQLADDVRYARKLGYTGKLCVHPKQVPVAAEALRPGEEEVRWARSVVATASDGVVSVDGRMVDKPVLDRAYRVLRRAGEPR